MNSLVGKSTGIALLMAAALIAALFAMGVFSAGTVGAQDAAPTATAELVADDDDTDTLDDDTLVIEVSGLKEFAVIADTTLTIAMPEDLGGLRQGGDAADDDRVVVLWGGDQADVNLGTPAAYDDTNDQYVFTMPIGSNIREGAATITISLGEGAKVDTNTIVTALTIGGTTDATRNTVDVGDGLAITGAPDGPSLTLSQVSAFVDPNAEDGTVDATNDDFDITVTGANFNGVSDITITIDPSTTGVTADDVTIDVDGDVTNGGFSTTVTVVGTVLNEAKTFAITATQDGDAIPATFTIAEAPLERDATSSTVPGSSQRLELRAMIRVDERDAITVKFAKFGVPSSIDADDVEIYDGTVTGNPSSVSVSGTTVTLYFTDLNGPGTDPENAGGASLIAQNSSSITFLKRAGITLPTSSDTFPIDVYSTDTTVELQVVKNQVTTERTVTVDPEEGKRGTEVTITGKGFSGSRAKVVINDGEDDRTYDSSVVVTDGAFSITVDTAAKDSEGDKYFGSDVTMINATDNDDMSDATPFEYDMTPSFTFKPETPVQSAKVTITLVDTKGEPEDVTFTGPIPVTGLEGVSDDTDAADETKWKFTVPANVSSGENKLSMTVGDDDLSATVNIGTNDLTITPSTVVPRQEISIDGGGFIAGGNIPEDTTDIGGIDNTVHAVQLVNNNGDISFNVRVPLGLDPGSRKVEVRDGGGRIGTANITIAEPTLTLDPAESLIGSTVTVSGTGFPANDLVLIKYKENTVKTAATTATGTFEEEILVPSGADINPGGEYTVVAESQIGVADAIEAVTADEEHSLPDTEITLSADTASAGSTITVTGANFKGFLQVYRVDIAGQNVTPVPAPTTDRWGSFTISDLRIPQLTPGRYAVKVTVEDMDGDSGTEFLQIVTEAAVPASTDPADVFADLGDRLARVWYLDQDDDDIWKFYDPSPVFAAFNTLTEVPREEVVVIIIKEGEAIEFPAATPSTLRPGTNNRFIN